MRKKKLNNVVGYILFVILVSLAISDGGSQAVLISEIQLAGETARDEFVELFNPSDSSVNLAGWRLRKKTSSGKEYNLITKFPDITMPPLSFLLVVHQEYKGEVEGDLVYSSPSYSVAADNTVLLCDPDGNIVDRVGMGKASDPEGNPTPNPDPGKSIERRLLILKNGICGPAMDTDDNKTDFLLRDNPTPCNSRSSPPKPVISFEVFPGEKGVNLIWVVDPGARGFKWKVYRRDEDGSVVLLTPDPLVGDKDLYEFSDLTPRKTGSEYFLEALDPMGNSFRSVTVTDVPQSGMRITIWAMIRR